MSMQKTTGILILSIIVILSWNDQYGQVTGQVNLSNCPKEKIEVQFSQDNIFTGEILWFKIYCTSSLFPGEEISCLAFIELVSSENTSIFRKKINLIHGSGTGEFEIPDNLSTGLYYVIAYTNWMKNFGEESFFRKEIIIVNPYQPLLKLSDSVDSGSIRNITWQNSNNAGELKIRSDKKKYSTREKVTVKIDPGHKPGKIFSGELSVSVSHKEPPLKYYITKRSDHIKAENPEIKSYLPDYRGIKLSGKVMDPADNPVSDAILMMSMPGPGTAIESDITDSNGEFNFLINPGEGEEDIVITMPDENNRLSLEESFWNGFRNPPDSMMIEFTMDYVSYLKEKFIYFQLQKRFNKQYFIRNVPVRHKADSSVFYNMPYQTIYPGNYIALDSLEEYFHELISSVRFTRKRGEYDISVIDQQSFTFLKEKPGLFLDGVLFDNYAALVNIPPAEIDRISIIPSDYYYKDLKFGGIIDIHTKKSDFNYVKLLPGMTRFIYPKASFSEFKFISPDYSVTGPPDRVPDFRYLLTWEPLVKSDSSGVATVQFYTGDITGNFVVKVSGISDDGEILQTENEFYVGE